MATTSNDWHRKQPRESIENPDGDEHNQRGDRRRYALRSLLAEMKYQTAHEIIKPQV